MGVGVVELVGDAVGCAVGVGAGGLMSSESQAISDADSNRVRSGAMPGFFMLISIAHMRRSLDDGRERCWSALACVEGWAGSIESQTLRVAQDDKGYGEGGWVRHIDRLAVVEVESAGGDGWAIDGGGCDATAAGVDDAADAGVRRAGHGQSILDAAEGQQLPVLVAFLGVKPTIVAEVGEEVDSLGSGGRVAGHARQHYGIYVLQADRGDEGCLRLLAGADCVVERERLKVGEDTGMQRLDCAVGGEEERDSAEPSGAVGEW